MLDHNIGFLLLYLQLEAAESLCHLIKKCLSRTPNPSVKVVKNLHGFLCLCKFGCFLSSGLGGITD
jgi:hypothetical protein